MDSLCNHEELRFASGDYYLICQQCWQYWVVTAHEDKAGYLPGHTNNTSLQGERRFKAVESKTVMCSDDFGFWVDGGASI